MTLTLRRTLVSFALLALVLPVFVIAADDDPSAPPADGAQDPESTAANYQFKNEGIFGCNQIAGVNMSAGTMAAIGGVYVPVNDAAVTLNTGILVYKECVLRPLLNRLKESAGSALFKKADTAIETGREGNKRYVEVIDDELLVVDDRAALTYLTGPALENVSPASRATLQRALARNYQFEARGNDAPDCDYEGDVNADVTNPTQRPFVPSNFAKLADPDCIPFFAYIGKKDELDAARATAKANQQIMWDWGRGFYAVTDNAADPSAEKILTPSSVLQESFQQILGSPVRQLETANDIGQMIGALYAGVTTQIISDSKGLAGITKSVAGQPSYLDQVAKESSQGVIGAAVNAALTILNATRGVEASYLASMNAVATTLTNTINQLRSTENQCWNLIIPKAREYAATGTCTTDPQTQQQTCTGQFELDDKKIQVSTSSQAFSKQVIDSQVTPLATQSLTNIQASQKALSLIDQLITGVTNTSALATQRLALQQLDSLVAQKLLHTQYDATNAAKQRDDVANAMSGLITDTAQAWGDSPDPNVGWCNVNNSGVIRAWAERWKK